MKHALTFGLSWEHNVLVCFVVGLVVVGLLELAERRHWSGGVKTFLWHIAIGGGIGFCIGTLELAAHFTIACCALGILVAIVVWLIGIWIAAGVNRELDHHVGSPS